MTIAGCIRSSSCWTNGTRRKTCRSRRRRSLRHCLDEIKRLAAELKLELNQKTQITPLSQGVDYVGFHFYLTDSGKVVRRLRTTNKRRFKRKLKAMRKTYEEGGIELEEINQRLASHLGHLSHGDTWRMRARTMAHFVLRRRSTSSNRDPPGDAVT